MVVTLVPFFRLVVLIIKLSMKTEWCDIEGYEGIYQVSNTGYVRSGHTGEWVVLKHTFASTGYTIVSLRPRMPKGFGKRKPDLRYVHRLVAEYFLLDWNPELEVDHLDGDRTNCHKSNLELVTPFENTRRMIRRKNWNKRYGVEHYSKNGFRVRNPSFKERFYCNSKEEAYNWYRTQYLNLFHEEPWNPILNHQLVERSQS